jgi:hypothetical protein
VVATRYSYKAVSGAGKVGVDKAGGDIECAAAA